MNVEMPDGTVITDVPDGVTQSEIARRYGKTGAAPKAAAQPQQVEQGQLGDIVAPLATGAIAAPLSGLAGIAGAVLPGPEGQGADWARKTQDALTYQPRTPTGKAVSAVVGYPFEKWAQGSDWTGGKVADVTGSPAAGAAVNAGMQLLPMALGGVLGKVAPGGETAAGIARRASAKAAAAQADAAAAAAREAGYALPPTQVNPSLANQALEGLGGKIKTAQVLSEKDQPISNAHIRSDLGLPPESQITPDILSGVRKTAGANYEAARNVGMESSPGMTVQPRVVASPEYFATLDDIAKPFRNAAADFPQSARTDVIKAVDSARRAEFDPGSAIDQIGILRDQGDVAFRGGDKRLGKAYKGIADALEEELGRHLERIGAPQEVLDNFRNARTIIAKTYTVEKYLKPSGNVDARALGQDKRRGAFTGGIKTVADFGANFPKAAQIPEKIGGVPFGPMDVILGGGGALATGHWPALAAAFGRTGLRKVLASDPYQNKMVSPPTHGPTLANRLLALPQSQLAQLLGMGEEQKRKPGLLGQPSAADIN